MTSKNKRKSVAFKNKKKSTKPVTDNDNDSGQSSIEAASKSKNGITASSKSDEDDDFVETNIKDKLIKEKKPSVKKVPGRRGRSTILQKKTIQEENTGKASISAEVVNDTDEDE